MVVVLNERAFAYAKLLIEEGHYVADEKGMWGEEKPTAQEEDEYLLGHGFGAYSQWYLGINDRANAGTKERYKFPYGDFTNVLRSGVIAAETCAGQYGHHAVEAAAAELLLTLDERAARH